MVHYIYQGFTVKSRVIVPSLGHWRKIWICKKILIFVYGFGVCVFVCGTSIPTSIWVMCEKVLHWCMVSSCFKHVVLNMVTSLQSCARILVINVTHYLHRFRVTCPSNSYKYTDYYVIHFLKLISTVIMGSFSINSEKIVLLSDIIRHKNTWISYIMSRYKFFCHDMYLCHTALHIT